MGPVTPATHPNLGWQRLVSPDGRINYPWIVFAVTPGRGQSRSLIYAFNERTGATFHRPCSTTPESGMPVRWVIHWAQQQ